MARAKGKSGNGKKKFVMLEFRLLKLKDYRNLSDKAKTLLTDILMQYNGNNNGDLCLSYKVMKEIGWNSNDKIQKAAKELIESEFLVKTRQGGRNQCNLYGVTWLPINECNNKLDIRPSIVPIKPLSLR